MLTRDPRLTARWLLKKAARRVVAGLSLALRWFGYRAEADRRGCVRVLTYHHVSDRPGDPFAVSEAEFNRQVEWLAARRLPVSLDDFVSFLNGHKDLPPGSVLITIDDGYDDLWTSAVPVLERHGVPAVAFIPAGEIGRPVPGQDCTRGTREQIAELSPRGIAVGSHAWDHRSLGTMTTSEALYQTTASRIELEKISDGGVQAFAYPFGTRLDFSAVTRSALERAGYECGFTSQHGAVTRDLDPLALPRIKVEGGDPFWVFRSSLTGALDAWSIIDRFAAAFQQTGRHSARATADAA
jgi:peptidoglycan/xylan/chitin deacetylase (PgdA/CDA1 family)